MAKILIEPYRESDRPDLVRFVRDLQDYERRLTSARRPGIEIAEQYVSELLEAVAKGSGATFMARDADADKNVGFLSCFVIDEENPIYTPETGVYGCISDAFVEQAYRGQGAFSALEQAAVGHFKAIGMRCVKITVLVKNESASRAYEKAGYAPEELTLMKMI